uniref:Holin n=1 Tax=viral metagenome TaxID=1070528 RepID=A0A6M3XFF1_9ZZZZ
MEILGIAVTWKWLVGGLVAVFAALKARKLAKAADEIEDVFKAIEQGKKDGQWTVDEVKEVVIQLTEAIQATAPLAWWLVKRLKG